MAESGHNPVWRVIGKSVRGASHVRANRPNQDAIDWLQTSPMDVPLMLAVSDGHGSAKCFRSDEGARLAVQTALREIQKFQDGQPDLANLSAIKRTAEEWLPRALLQAWEQAVDAHLTQHPLSLEKRLETLEQEAGKAARHAVEANPRLAYGATLLIVLVAKDFVLYLQLGDGEMLTVSEQGEVSKPLPKDERLFANETTSLCSSNAWRDFQVRFQAFSGRPPALLLLATDGYPNSFRNEEAFLKVGSDLLSMIREEGLDKVNDSLEAWLTEASQVGSGDDITLGILCHMNAVQAVDALDETERHT